MRTSPRRTFARRLGGVLAVTGLLVGSSFAYATTTAPAAAGTTPDYAEISGSGSSWAANAIRDWTSNGAKYGWKVNYSDTGSTVGRTSFLQHTVDFAVSDIPFQARPTDGSAQENPLPGTYAYMPIVAGGTAFMYNLTIGGKRVTNLRLSGANIAKIFTGGLSTWNDPAIAADNPGLTLPATKIVPVVRSDGSGSSAQFSLWMIDQQKAIWDAYYQKLGRGSVGGETSYWPTTPSMKAQSGDSGVANYIQQPYGEGAIGYVQYSYAINAKFPVAKMLNASGYYVEPTAQNVAVALLKAQIETANHDPAVYLTQQLSGVYADTDERTYPMSAYSYMILPTYNPPLPAFSAAKAATLGAFGKYLLCQGQQNVGSLGYSPLPLNLVQAGFDQLKTVPNVNVGDLTISSCNNPTFSPDGTNRLATTAPFPQACDKQGPTQCTDGTGGASAATPVKASARGATTGSTVAAAGTVGTVTAATAASSVDPNTGLAVDGAAGSGSIPLAGPVSLSTDQSGWSGAQTLAVLAATLLLAVFVAPPLLIRRLTGPKPGTDRPTP